jgi:hypothetical protein
VLSADCKHHRWTGLIFMSLSLSCFGIGWLCSGIGLLLVGRFGDTAHNLLPVSVIVWGALWPAVQAWLFRATAGHLRVKEDASSQRNPPTPRRLDGGVCAPP